MAKEYAYDYRYSTAAELSSYPYADQQQQQVLPKIKKKTAAKPKIRINQMLSVMLIAAIFIVVFRYTVINEMNYNNTKLANQLTAVTAETDMAKISLDKTTDLKYVESVAKNQLGMDFPQSYQVVNVTLSYPDKAVRAAEEAPGFFTTIRNFFSSVLEYLY